MLRNIAHTPSWIRGRRRRNQHGRWGLLALVFLAESTTAWAASSDKARHLAAEAVSEVETASARLKSSAIARRAPDVAALIAASELHLRMKQYDAAIDKLSLVVELRRQGKATAGSDADAQYLLGQAYFATGQFYSAKRHFIEVIDHADEPSHANYGGPAASRLVDIALQTQRIEELPDVLGKVEQMLQRSMSSSLMYARAKALFALGRYGDARAQAESVGGTTIYAQRASYLRGTALMKELQAAHSDPDVPPDFGSAIAAFEQAAVPAKDAQEDAADAQRITDLSRLAVARLHYAGRNFTQAATAFEKIPRSSDYFADALFELSWTYVHLGEYHRAQRALEALAVLEPGLVDGADGELLRADLLLRAGRFQEAQDAYELVRGKYEPLREQVQAFVDSHDDPAIYYDKLTAEDIETGHDLPEVAIDWARQEAHEERVFAIVDDVARSRSLIKRSRKIITLLRATLASESRAKVFPEVQRQLQDVVALLNQLAAARLTLARGMDSEAGTASAQLSTIRAQRRKLMDRVGELPTNHGGFSVREAQTEKNWNSVSQSLQRLQLEADHLKALVNGLHRVVSDATRHGVSTDEATLTRYRQEISENEKDLAVYYERIDELRQQVEIGRVQSGFGDERFVEDDKVREAFSKLFQEETNLAAGGADPKAASYATEIKPLLGRIAVLEARLEGARKQLDAQAQNRGDEVRAVMDTEAAAMEIYASRLDTMDQHARVLVGEVARSNFIKAKDRIKNVVLRADVGLVQQAWEVREEQQYRVRDLLRERAQEERFINDELREVLDDAEEQ